MTERLAIHKAEQRLQTILKAVVVGARKEDPASRPGGEDLAAAFTQAGALEPPYDPEALCVLMEHSNSLRQNVDAYATNIDGFGHRFECTCHAIARPLFPTLHNMNSVLFRRKRKTRQLDPL